MSLVKELHGTTDGGSQLGATLYDIAIRQRLSVAVQRGKAACIIGNLHPVVGCFC